LLGEINRRIAVIGAGSWGTSLAHLLGLKGYAVHLWARRQELVDQIRATRENVRYLPGVKLPENVILTSSFKEAVDEIEIFLLVLPSHGVRAVMTNLAPYLPQRSLIVIASKGIENGTLMMMSEVLESVLSQFHREFQLGVMSGPSFAQEVSAQLPTAVVVASSDEHTAKEIQSLLMAPYFRVYTSTDVTGVQLGGALKNVIAIAAGIVDGCGLGYNTRTALITRGLAEISRLGLAMGANPLTFSGLAGMGDLVLTCTGHLSRNRTVGLKIAQGMKLDEILSGTTMVAEGVNTTKAAVELGKKYRVELPIVQQVFEVLFNGKDPRVAVEELMSRDPKSE